jgi:hypothetical protein
MRWLGLCGAHAQAHLAMQHFPIGPLPRVHKRPEQDPHAAGVEQSQTVAGGCGRIPAQTKALRQGNNPPLKICQDRAAHVAPNNVPIMTKLPLLAPGVGSGVCRPLLTGRKVESPAHLVRGTHLYTSPAGLSTPWPSSSGGWQVTVP